MITERKSGETVYYPSVTEVLSKYQDFSSVPEDRLAFACERGTAVHKWCAAYARGLWIPVPETGPGYCKSFQQWFDEYVEQVIFVEREMICNIYGFMGHPDLGCIMKGDNDISVVDLKTPIAVQQIWRAQLAAYLHLSKTRRAFSLRLRPDGSKPLLNEYTDTKRDFQAFLAALTAHKYFT
jgi:hypothetical protein